MIDERRTKELQTQLKKNWERWHDAPGVRAMIELDKTREENA